jgi:hypothetical protein
VAKVFVVIEERDYAPIIPQNVLATWVATERHLREHGRPGEARELRNDIEQAIMKILSKHAFIHDNTLARPDKSIEDDDERTWAI